MTDLKKELKNKEYKKLILDLSNLGLIGSGTTLVEAGDGFIENSSKFKKIITYVYQQALLSQKQEFEKWINFIESKKMLYNSNVTPKIYVYQLTEEELEDLKQKLGEMK